jgi:hypothetical protein
MCLDRCRTRLLVSEYEIDPLVQMLSSQVKSSQVKSSQVKSSQVKSSQVKSYKGRRERRTLGMDSV